jgi:dTDP-4-amino-4,6-dideoxygalactose transaminase
VFRGVAFWLFRYAYLNNVDRINNHLKIDLDPQVRHQLPAEYAVRMLPVQARLIRSQFDQVDAHTEKRIEAARIYHDGLKDIEELILPPERRDGSHMYWYYPIQYADRGALVRFAMQHMRDITESYHRNCAGLSCFAEFARPCPNAQATADSLIYLPTYPRYPHAEIRRTVEIIRKFFGR